MADALRGSCLCGGVAYEITPPFLFFHYCHCSRCRKTSGSAHSANLLVRRGQFTWTRGEELMSRWELPSAERFCTGFCTVCGSSLPWQTRDGKAYLVPAGTLDDTPSARPERNIFWDSRAEWCVLVDDLPAFAEGPRGPARPMRDLNDR